MKTVNYRGMTFEIEDRFKYIAMDDNGDIFIFENKPVINKTYCKWFRKDDSSFQLLHSVDQDWENSLENC